MKPSDFPEITQEMRDMQERADRHGDQIAYIMALQRDGDLVRIERTATAALALAAAARFYSGHVKKYCRTLDEPELERAALHSHDIFHQFLKMKGQA